MSESGCLRRKKDETEETGHEAALMLSNAMERVDRGIAQ